MSAREPNASREPPLSYTPPRLVDRILSSRAGLEGERKHVTILFADVKDSMELVASRDPEEARRLLDPVLELMMEAVHRYEGIVQTRPLGPIVVKGLSDPVEVFELLGAWPARTPWQARVTRGLTPFVGREFELATLRQSVAWAEAGHGQLLAIAGEPGVGKS